MDDKLQLSDLHHGVDYPMPCEENTDRCRIHVKMTEVSMKSVEALIHSDKVRDGRPRFLHCMRCIRLRHALLCTCVYTARVLPNENIISLGLG